MQYLVKCCVLLDTRLHLLDFLFKVKGYTTVSSLDKNLRPFHISLAADIQQYFLINLCSDSARLVYKFTSPQMLQASFSACSFSLQFLCKFWSSWGSCTVAARLLFENLETIAHQSYDFIVVFIFRKTTGWTYEHLVAVLRLPCVWWRSASRLLQKVRTTNKFARCPAHA